MAEKEVESSSEESDTDYTGRENAPGRESETVSDGAVPGPDGGEMATEASGDRREHRVAGAPGDTETGLGASGVKKKSPAKKTTPKQPVSYIFIGEYFGFLGVDSCTSSGV